MLPFDAATQCMATSHDIEGQTVVYVKGAIERLLPCCTTMLAGDGRSLPVDVAGIGRHAEAMAAHGERVLAFARIVGAGGVTADGALSHAALADGLEFIGLAGMIDPPRPRAVTAIRACHAAGIRVKMITGDHAATAWPLRASSASLARPATVRAHSAAANWRRWTMRSCDRPHARSMSSRASSPNRSCAWCRPCSRTAKSSR